MTLSFLLEVLSSAPLGGESKDPFQYLFGHVLPHQIGEVTLFGTVLPVFNLQLFQVGAIGMMFLVFAGTARAVRTNTGGLVARVTAAWVDWLRKDVIYPVLNQKDADRMMPFFLSLFFFILFMNVFGLVPFGATATASVFVTGALAFITLLIMLVGGMIAQGPVHFWLALVPSGVPGWLWPLLFVLEIAGLVIKPFALMVRLFANMLGGHLVILSFIGLAFHFGSEFSIGLGLTVAPISIGMSVFMMIIEGFVALLQAYIFTLLSAIFISMCLHPDH
ncbi:MAG: F0F1 ATP synthase subunit A [Planctomycetes bacterium]|nr:F0F1 ATP synthase subunit A [Planctomycetota bacterium]